jgi:hypothetical protein
MPASGAVDGKKYAYRALLEFFRDALLMARGLTGAQRQVALMMLARSNRQEFYETGKLYSWMSERTLTICSGLSDRGVRKAREDLQHKGVIVVTEKGGSGPGDTSKYEMSGEWLLFVRGELKRQGVMDVWDGKRGNASSSLARPPDTSARGNTRSAKGEPPFQKRGNASSPEPLDRNLLNKPSDGALTRAAFGNECSDND